MDVPLADVLNVGTKFTHEYDFGSTTELRLRVVGEREGVPLDDEDPVTLLARNDPPDIRCVVCGEPATQVCTSCNWQDQGWLCDKCAPKHECGEEMLLPVVNSPRVGVCGYTGELDYF
jgi:hypothetical protein